MVQEGPEVGETLALQTGPEIRGKHSKAWHTPVVNLYNDM
jgi:hypothetical protein